MAIKKQIPRSEDVYIYDHGEEVFFVRRRRKQSADNYGTAFAALFVFTLIIGLLYFSGFAHLFTRSDPLFALSLICMWGVFFSWKLLLKVPLLGAALRGSVFLFGAVVMCSIYGFIYYKIFADS